MIAYQDTPAFRHAVGACAANFEATAGGFDWLEIRSCLLDWSVGQAAASLREWSGAGATLAVFAVANPALVASRWPSSDSLFGRNRP